MSTPTDFTSIDLDLEALADALVAIQEALEEFPGDLRRLIRVEPLDAPAVDQAARCEAGHVSHVDRDGRWSCPCRPADPDAPGIDLSATDGGWRVVATGSRTEGVPVIPVEDGDLLVVHDEGTYVVSDVWAGSEIAIGITLDLSAAGALKDFQGRRTVTRGGEVESPKPHRPSSRVSLANLRGLQIVAREILGTKR